MQRQKLAPRGPVDGKHVKQMRELSGLSIALTAHKSGISAIWLNNFELGRVTLKAERYEKLVRILHRACLERSKQMSFVLEHHEAQQARQIGP
jgi:transcriptional regulator with XRE-family HTH domain